MFLKKIFWRILLAFALLITLGLAGFWWVFHDLPSLDSLPSRLYTPSVQITDRQGRILYEVLPQEGGRHAVISLDSIPARLKQATLATEDSHFYENPGVDLNGILRSMWINLRGGETLAGGSTITQQVARNLLLANERSERTVRRKLRETVLAWQLSRRYSKDEILALYLNQTYYGGMAYGVEAAAQTFFAKPAGELDLAEAALIAGLPQAPGSYNPFTDMAKAKKRQSIVLGLMQKTGFISDQQRALAESEPLVLASAPYPIEAPHFVMMVRSQIDNMYSAEQVYQSGGLVVRTSLDLDWQHRAELAVRQQLDRLKQSDDSLGHNVNDAALVAIDPHSGEILAMVGSPDYFDAQHAGAINMALAPRQPGSALKPLIYAAAFDPQRQPPWTPATMILDISANFVTHDGQAYTPANFDDKEHGPVLARDALASSLNIPAVKTLDHIGLATLFAEARQFGITTLGDPDNYDLSLALGGGDVSLLELSAAYGAFATGGYKVTPYSILDVRDAQGKVLYSAKPAGQQRVLDQRVAWLISDILSDDNARVIGFGRNSVLKLDRPAAVKTGTTTNFHDNWTIGYTPSLVVGVWAGNSTYDPMRNVTGLTGAAPVWAQFMRTVLAGKPEEHFVQPPGLVKVEVCTLSGLLPGPACPYRQFEWFIAGTQPTETDHFYREVTVDTETGRLADDSTPPERRQSEVVLDLPPQAQAWARSLGLPLLSDLQATAENASPETPATTIIKLISPPAAAVYRIAADLPIDSQRLPIQVVGEDGLHGVSIIVDGSVLATLDEQPFEAWWPLSAGKHTAWAEATRSNGERVSSEKVDFEVEK